MNQLMQDICTAHLGVKPVPPAPAKVREAYTPPQTYWRQYADLLYKAVREAWDDDRISDAELQEIADGLQCRDRDMVSLVAGKRLGDDLMMQRRRGL